MMHLIKKEGYLNDVNLGDTTSDGCLAQRIQDFQRRGGRFASDQWHRFCVEHFKGGSGGHHSDSKDPSRVPNPKLKEFFEEVANVGCWFPPSASGTVGRGAAPRVPPLSGWF